MQLKEYIKQNNLGNIYFIEYRIRFVDNEKVYDEFFGSASFVNGELIPHDGDCYLLTDEFDVFKEFKMEDLKIIETPYRRIVIPKDSLCLTVWEETADYKKLGIKE